MSRNTITLHSPQSPEEIADTLRNLDIDASETIVVGSVLAVGEHYDIWLRHAHHRGQAIFDGKLEKAASGTRIEGKFSRNLSEDTRFFLAIILGMGAMLLFPAALVSIINRSFDGVWFFFISGMTIWTIIGLIAFIRPIKATDRQRYLDFLEKHLHISPH